MEPASKNIFITGDIAQDHFIFRGNRVYSDDPDKNKKGTRYTHHKGGAYIIYELLNSLSENRKGDNNRAQLDVEFSYHEGVFDTIPEKNKGYALVSNYGKDTKKAWRIADFLGFGNAGDEIIDFGKYFKPSPSDPDIVIINDDGLDFSAAANKDIRDKIIRSCKETKRKGKEPLIILKKSGELSTGGFTGELLKDSAAGRINLMTIISVNDIRRLDVKVSTGLSWEQSVEDLVSELGKNNTLRGFLKSRYLIVTFQSSGALIIRNKGKDKSDYCLIYDPEKMEGEDEDQGKGKITGHMLFFSAILAAETDLQKIDTPSVIENAVKKGLTAIRIFYGTGYSQPSAENIYPFRELADSLGKNIETIYSAAYVPSPETIRSGEEPWWSILIDNYSDRKKKKGVELKALTSLAKNIVINGPRILKNVPAGRFGDIYTVDRNEIESLRNLKMIMESYIKFDKGKKPLSLAVFGPPGAGKSFAVEQIGKGVMGEMYELLCFNLSQFKDPDDLIGALHQVRDQVLRKKLPLVFWDEFDSKSFFWLQYLLAPMQDGAFQEGQITHPVGKCIFVFAGGTSYNMEAFGKFSNAEQEKDFVLKKGPDFISRLNGFINILGPNRRQILKKDYRKEDEKWVDDPGDVYFPIRRALFIISLLRLKEADFPIKMDWGLLNALIRVDRYKHGSRSLANLLNDIKQNNPRNQLMRSWLPSRSTLDLYFRDADNFIKCMERENDFLEMAWETAPLIHSYWAGKMSDPASLYSVDYNLLPVFVKESNVMSVKRIPEVLKTGGFKTVPFNSPDKIENDEYSEMINKNNGALLEKMSKKEHELWVDFYIENGWEYAEARNDYEKKHDCLVAYEQLPEKQKIKDRAFVSNIHVIVEKAGFGIARDK